MESSENLITSIMWFLLKNTFDIPPIHGSSISKYLRFRSFLLFLPSHKLVWQFKGIIIYLVQKSLHDEDFSTNFLCWLWSWELRVTLPCPLPLKWGSLLADNQLVLQQLQGRIIFLLANCETSNTSYHLQWLIFWHFYPSMRNKFKDTMGGLPPRMKFSLKMYYIFSHFPHIHVFVPAYL